MENIQTLLKRQLSSNTKIQLNQRRLNNCQKTNNLLSLQKFSEELTIIKTNREKQKQKNLHKRKQSLKKIDKYLTQIKQFLNQNSIPAKTSSPIGPPIPYALAHAAVSPLYSINPINCSTNNKTYLPSISSSTNTYSNTSTNQNAILKSHRETVYQYENQHKHINKNKQKNRHHSNFRKSEDGNYQMKIRNLQALVDDKIDNRNKNKGKVNRFRVAGIGIFFCLLFPAFCRKISLIRSQWFISRFQTPSCLQYLTFQTIQKLNTQNLFHMYKKSKIHQSPCPFVSSYCSNQATKYPIINFLTLLLQSISSLLTDKLFLISNHEIFSTGIMNKNLYIEYQNGYMYLPEEMEFLTLRKIQNWGVSQGQNYQLEIGKETEIALLVIRVMIKIVIYGYLGAMIENWGEFQEKIYGQIKRDRQNNENVEFMFDQSCIEEIKYNIQICIVFLHSLCVQMYEKGLKNFKNNLQNDNQGAQKLYMAKENILRTNIESISKNSISKNSIFSSKIIANQTIKSQQQNTFYNNKEPFSYIKRMRNYEEIQQKIQNSKVLNDFKQQAVNKILQIVLQIHKYLRLEQKRMNRYIWDLALQEKYFLKKDAYLKNKQKTYFPGSIAYNQKQKKSSHRRYKSQNSQQQKSLSPLQNLKMTQNSPKKTQRSILKKSTNQSQCHVNKNPTVSILQSQSASPSATPFGLSLKNSRRIKTLANSNTNTNISNSRKYTNTNVSQFQ